MSEDTPQQLPPKRTTRQKAADAGAKTPQDNKAEASAKLKALRAEAAEGDVVVELHGEFFTVHVAAFNTRMQDDYEFMELATQGVIPALLGELLSQSDTNKLKEIARNDDGRIPTERMGELFSELMEVAGQGN